MRSLLLSTVVMLGVAGASESRREVPISERDKAALERIEAQGQELAKVRAQLDEAEKALKARYEAVVAEIRSALSLRPTDSLKIEKGLYVVEAAPVTSR